MSDDRFDVREIPWTDHKTGIQRLTFRDVRRQFPSTALAQRPVKAVQARDEAPDTRHLAAFAVGGGLVGTVRLAALSTPEALGAFDLADLPRWFRAAELSGLAVADDARDTALPVELLAAAFKRARALGCHVLVTRVWSEQVMMYEAFGFFRYQLGRNDAERGFTHAMMLNLHDVTYLRLVESPLTRLAQRYLNPDEHGPLLLARFRDVVAETRPPRSRPSLPTGPDPEGPPLACPAPAPSLTLDLQALLARLGHGARQRLTVGTRLVAPDLPSRDIYLVISGTLGVLLEGDAVPSCYLQEGDVIAESAFADAAVTRPLAIVTLTECAVVRMTAAELQRVVAEDPTLGSKLLYALLAGVSTRLARHLDQWAAAAKPGPQTSRWRTEVRRSLAPQRPRLPGRPTP